MNTDYSDEIKKARDNQDANRLLSDPTMTNYEIKLAHGRHVLNPVYLLFMTNAMIYASRNNLLNCRKFFLASVLGSLPLTYLTCRYVFGYDKLRRIEKIESDTFQSAKLYENLANKK